MAKVFLFPKGMSFNISCRMARCNPLLDDCGCIEFRTYCKNSKEFIEFFGKPRDAAFWRYWYDPNIDRVVFVTKMDNSELDILKDAKLEERFDVAMGLAV